MKIYAFAPISACEYPTIKLLDHHYIWGGVQFSLNVSEKPYSQELEKAMASHGIEWDWSPVLEEDGAQWWDSLERGLRILHSALKAGKRIIVHCDCGNNRSQSFVEAFHYLETGCHLKDEYKGEYNHLIYNCKLGHLPPLEEVQERIQSLIPGLVKKMDEQYIIGLFHSISTLHCATPFYSELHDAVNNYKAGKPVGNGITVDEVKVHAPRMVIEGETTPMEMVDQEGIDGFTPEKGHEYLLKVQRIFITRDPYFHYYVLLDILEDNLAQ